jgi:N-acetylglucosamine malate deacetylase 1
MVVAPHPDDETLGCGGTLLRHKQEGDEIHWLIMTSMDHKSGFSSERIVQRDKEIKIASTIYGFESVSRLDFLTIELDTYSTKDLIGKISECFQKIEPEIIYVPFRNDIHSDHKIVFDSVASCTKQFRYPFIKKIRAYETLSETEFSMCSGTAAFKPNLWIDISEFIDSKIKIMEAYSSELGVHPFPRSERNIRALATLRGATAGFDSAEAFMSLKEIL